MIDIKKWKEFGEFVSENWLATVVGIVIGGVAIGAYYEKIILPRISRPKAKYETWLIKGAVDLQSGNVSYSDVTTSIQPPDLRLMPDGSFTAQVLVEVKSNGQKEYPKLIFSGIAGHTTPVVHISEPGAKLPPGTEDYEAQHILRRGEIMLKKKIKFITLPEEPWKPTQRPEKIKAVGGQPEEAEN